MAGRGRDRYARAVDENRDARDNSAPTGVERFKREAALRALALVESGMLLGLGTGSTARWLVAELGARLERGELRDVQAVPTSLETERQAQALGIPLVELPASGVDLAIDGMDELAPGLDAIKGLGGALTREKIVAFAASRFVLIGDDSKLVSRLGEKAPVPVEVAAFGHQRTGQLLAEMGVGATLRQKGGAPFVTDNGNLVYDCRFEQGFEAPTLALALAELPGVVEHGLFLDLADVAFVASADGVAELTPEEPL